MSAAGFQDFWVAGSRFYYQRDAVATIEQPWVDLGVIQPANPTLTIEKIELEDSDGGIRSTCAEKVTKIDENYDITCSNLSLSNLALLFLANEPSAFTQLAATTTVAHYAHPGRLVKVKDADGVLLYNIRILGVVDGTTTAIVTDTTVTAVTPATKTITLSTDLTTKVTSGDTIVLAPDGLTDKDKASSYTVASVTSTTVVVNEDISGAAETSLTGTKLLYIDQTGSPVDTMLEKDTDWNIYSDDRGLLRLVDGGAFSAAGNIRIIYYTNAVSGDRLINPQDIAGEINGTGVLIWGRDNNAKQTVREARISITPSSANIQVEDFSNFVISVRVLSDITSVTPAGRILQFKGDLPNPS